ncbi:hypothetical protein LF41_2194 [Lysobacter dokdonensis DS-58]|uniref:Lipoprotein n=1 Tax=Lysobacter dokdonensis DS-58 TaxID=1300345 RepID=A0A0A2WMR9_9GAMM|nr:hypothetical protein [Lysobacter dokdonensis]KGQ20027.1 hypothetical protein LF41_2194 [Lysobacter dokdonensis DS-58]
MRLAVAALLAAAAACCSAGEAKTADYRSPDGKIALRLDLRDARRVAYALTVEGANHAGTADLVAGDPEIIEDGELNYVPARQFIDARDCWVNIKVAEGDKWVVLAEHACPFALPDDGLLLRRSD